MPFALHRPNSWPAKLRQHPRTTLIGVAVLVAGIGTLLYLAMAAEQGRLQQAERAKEQQLRLETRLKLVALNRREEQLLAEERRKQELARRDTIALQLAALEADITSQERDLNFQRRTAVERQSAQLQQEQQRRRKELQDILKEEVKGELASEESAACISAFARYDTLKRNSGSSPEELTSALTAVKELCKT